MGIARMCAIARTDTEKGAVDQIRYALVAQDGAERYVKGGQWSNLTNVLHWVTRHGNPETMRFLLSLPEVDVNVQDASGLTPLHWAVKLARRVKVALLLNAPGVNVNARELMRRATPLHVALCSVRVTHEMRRPARIHHDTVELLLSAPGIDVNSRDVDGTTPLQLAVLAAQYGLIDERTVKRLLMSAGIDVNARDSRGRTPLHMSLVMERRLWLIEALLNAPGVDVNAGDAVRMTALHRAAEKHDVDVIKLILKAPGRIDLTLRDKRGRTAADVAQLYDPTNIEEKRRLSEIVSLLTPPPAERTSFMRRLWQWARS
ncbi:Ankyrin repeat domain-containing protein [Plasmodiophora brassicae]|uniref:Uncharacterized protein n=1 Tax=Plasmodiophora brassicae TaxID=37360 RepID=A0A0G4IT18_PLABS|nr:hypothetical protein PBRA_006612 [Plasmodiophora brassicae]